MRRRELTETGQADLLQIHDYIATRAPQAAALFYRQALSTFEDFPDDFRTPPPASDQLPDHVRVLHLGSPFRGYTLWVAFLDEALYLVSAFAPGLPQEYKDAHTLQELRRLG